MFTEMLRRLYNYESYIPENGKEPYFPQDFLNIAKGNVRYALILRDRMEWQFPETVVQDDLIEGEIVEFNDQYIVTDGEEIEIK